jgi:hypothetical protein
MSDLFCMLSDMRTYLLRHDFFISSTLTFSVTSPVIYLVERDIGRFVT